MRIGDLRPNPEPDDRRECQIGKFDGEGRRSLVPLEGEGHAFVGREQNDWGVVDERDWALDECYISTVLVVVYLSSALLFFKH